MSRKFNFNKLFRSSSNSTYTQENTGKLFAWFQGPDNIAAVFWISSAVAIATILPMEPWSGSQLIYLWFAEIFSIVAATVTPSYPQVFPRALHSVGLVIATFGIAGLAHITDKFSLDLSVLFIWVSLYAAINFSLKVTIYFIAFTAIVHGFVLLLAHSAGAYENWLEITITSFVTGGTVGILVRELKLVSLQDSLTKLPNRRAWNQKLDEELERSKRTSSPLSVAMIDIDGMKALNDNFGHAAGDILLKSLGERWMPLVRKGTLVARIGGDEFSVVAPDTDEDGITMLSKRLGAATPDVTFSTGIATWNKIESAAELLARADENMYKMKLHKKG